MKNPVFNLPIPKQLADELDSRTERRLLGDDDVLDAALWRLADWTIEELERGAAIVASLRQLGAPLIRDQPDIRRALLMLERSGDRRDPWTALAALLVLHADACGDVSLFWRAGFDVVTARRNSRARVSSAALNEFAAMVADYQANRPHATADEQFDFWAAIAGTHPVLAEHDSRRDVLTYVRNGRLVDINRASFARLFRRVRERRSAGCKESEEMPRTQRVAVRHAA